MENLHVMEKNIPIILCKLEQIFPPSFFDSMEHLPIHLPYEARVGGPMQYRWIYPFERLAIYPLFFYFSNHHALIIVNRVLFGFFFYFPTKWTKHSQFDHYAYFSW